MRHIESNIQKQCVKWFTLQYPEKRGLFFAVGNGGARNRTEAAIMKGEGVTAGVADILFLYPTNRYHGLCIEFKTPKGRQTDSQKEFQFQVEQVGYCYIIVRNVPEFVHRITKYINNGDMDDNS